MMWFIIITLIIIPVVEIMIFIWVGDMVGIWSVLLLILLTGVLGTLFVRSQGIQTWRKLQMSIRSGRPPGDDILSVICIVIGGVLLVLPGLLTDLIGILLVIPFTRGPFKALILHFIMRTLAKRGTIVYRK